jgi:hypothetical protein
MARPRRGAVGIAWGLAAVLVLAAGCGATEEPEITGTRMGAAPEADTRVGANRPPRIESLRLKPRSPHSGGFVEAVARVSDPDGDPTWVLYEWMIDGVKGAASLNRLPLQLVSKGAHIEVRAIPTDGKMPGAEVRASTKVVNAPPRVTEAEYDVYLPVRRGQTAGVVAQGDDSDLEDRRHLTFSYRVVRHELTAKW